MKNSMRLYSIFLLVGFFTNACYNKVEAEKKENYQKAREKVKYQCPKLCEGDKYCEEQLMCPKCNEGMEIIVSAKKSN